MVPDQNRPKKIVSGYYGGRPIQFGFFDGAPMDANMHPAWEGSLLHNGFVQRFRQDGATVMVPFDHPSVQASPLPPTDTRPQQVDNNARKAIQSLDGVQEREDGKPSETVEDDIISISSIEDDGAKHAPGDSAYRGRASRVKTDGEFSRPNTRRQTAIARGSRRARRVVKSSAVIVSSEEDGVEEPNPNSPPFTQPRLQPSPLPKSTVDGKRDKGKEPVNRERRSRQDVSSGGDDPRPTKRQTVMDTVDISDSDSLPDLASILGELVKRNKKTKGSKKEMIDKVNGLFRSSKRWRNTFLDLEAVEDNGSVSGGDAGDGYDTSDSFIDDSAIAVDGETSIPGLEFEDFAREAKAKKRQQIEDDRYMAEAMTRHAMMVEASMSQSCQGHGDSRGKELPSTPGKRVEQSMAEADKGFADDEFGVNFYRTQFEEAIRKSREEHERRARGRSNGASSSTPHHPTGPQTGTTPVRPPPYRPRYRGPPPQYTPNPGYMTQMVTPPDSARARASSSAGLANTVSSVPAEEAASAPNEQINGTSRTLRFTWPAQCEVNDATLQDPLLASDYANLAKLRAGSFVPWSNAPGKGLVRFSAWKDQAPDMDPSRAFQAVRFVRHQEFINPSRASPADLDIKEISGGLHSHSHRLHAYLDGQPAVCVSAIYSELSFLRTLTHFGLPQNMLQGKLHTQEFDRLVGFFCMAFGIPELHANLARDSMHFVTRPVSRDTASGGPAGMFSKSSSPSTKRTVSNRLPIDHFALDSKNDVPIYDARSVTNFDFAKDLPLMESKLPQLVGEVPFGSFAYVGYTATVYKAGTGNWTLSCNIRWVIVIGVPPLVKS
ncbi:hypothetical protein CC2G_000236 [Coprinopsis cinerea AmutBmut pab1-1]|nr:hypothetical protein CC2G_000236 [Coprinopsis cinerea AmutBmut pab1-1]